MKLIILNALGNKEREVEEWGKREKWNSIKRYFIKLSLLPEPPMPVQHRNTEVKNTISGSTGDILC